MKSLFLLRHARATRSPEGDHERPLDPRGRDEAHRVGLFLSRLGSQPELVLTSSARRARTTAELAAAAGDYLGPERAAAGFSILTLMFAVGQVLGPAGAGILAGWTGGFAVSYGVAAGLNLLAVVLCLFLRPPAEP